MTFAMRRKMLNFTRYFVLFLVSMVMIYPLLWMVSRIFQSNNYVFTNTGLLPTVSFSEGMENLGYGWNTRVSAVPNLFVSFLNTLRFLIPRVVGQVVSSVLTAYAITRFHFKGKKIVFSLVIATLLMPDIVLRIPLFNIFSGGNPFGINLLGTYIPLYLENWFATGSFFVFMLIQFMRTIPKELDEAAKIDGCSSLQTLVFILLPVMKPAIITVALLTFMWGMNDFLGPLIYIRDSSMWVLQQALRQTSEVGEAAIIWSEVFASAVLALVPAITLFFVAQRYFIDGIASTGSKE